MPFRIKKRFQKKQCMLSLSVTWVVGLGASYRPVGEFSLTLSREEMARWVAKLGRWVAKLRRGVAKSGRRVAKLVRRVAKLWRRVAKWGDIKT